MAGSHHIRSWSCRIWPKFICYRSGQVTQVLEKEAGHLTLRHRFFEVETRDWPAGALNQVDYRSVPSIPWFSVGFEHPIWDINKKCWYILYMTFKLYKQSRNLYTFWIVIIMRKKSLKWFQIPIGEVRDLNNEKSQLLPCAIDFSD